MAIKTYDLGSVLGPQGPQGIQGLVGASGPAPTIGVNGNWYINERDTGIMGDASKAVGNKIVASTVITEPGFIMDGKTCSEAFTKVNKGLESNVADVFTPYNAPTFANKDMYSNGLSYWRKVGKTVTFHFSVQGVGTGGYKMITGLPGAVGSAIFPFMTVYGVGNGALIIDTSGTGSLSEVKLNVNSVVSGSYICN